jgi:hypothetical protein
MIDNMTGKWRRVKHFHTDYEVVLRSVVKVWLRIEGFLNRAFCVVRFACRLDAYRIAVV